MMVTSKSADIKTIRALLFKWNREKNKRHFFWRTSELNLFQYMMVELLLQKTRAENAEKVIKAFAIEFKSPESIIKASKEKVERLIKPLGLQNQRLKVILKIAEYCHENDKIDLDKIFGVGHYIRNAIKCFYFNQRAPLLDTNTARITFRLFGIKNNVDLRANKELLAEIERFLPGRNYRKFNWILLDFGATICKPKPLCKKCPITGFCNHCKGKES